MCKIRAFSTFFRLLFATPLPRLRDPHWSREQPVGKHCAKERKLNKWMQVINVYDCPFCKTSLCWSSNELNNYITLSSETKLCSFTWQRWTETSSDEGRIFMLHLCIFIPVAHPFVSTQHSAWIQKKTWSKKSTAFDIFNCWALFARLVMAGLCSSNKQWLLKTKHAWKKDREQRRNGKSVTQWLNDLLLQQFWQLELATAKLNA